MGLFTKEEAERAYALMDEVDAKLSELACAVDMVNAPMGADVALRRMFALADMFKDAVEHGGVLVRHDRGGEFTWRPMHPMRPEVATWAVGTRAAVRT